MPFLLFPVHGFVSVQKRVLCHLAYLENYWRIIYEANGRSD